MEVFNRFKNTVSSALPGNPVTREYDVGKQVGSAGSGLLWKVYEATKKSTKQDASVWLLEKRLLDQYPKSDRESLLTVMKKGVSQLTRLRHPKILSVLHPLEESRESLGFVTEPVFASLANMLGCHDNLPEPLITQLKEFELYDTEIKYGTMQLAEGLTFLHTACKQVHCNISPETVVINKPGAWKLACFDFSVVCTGALQSAVDDTSSALVVSVPEWQASYPPVGQPSLDFSPPETVLQGRASPAGDMFSLGLLLYAVYNKGRSLFDSRNQLSVYRKNADQLKQLRVSVLQSLPENLREYVKLMLNYEATVRPDADQFTKIPFFDDPGVATLQNLDNLKQLDNLAKSQFYKALPKTITALPKRINIHRVYPLMAEEFVNANMVPFVLPSVLQIADMGTEAEFAQFILPRLIPVFKIAEPIQITLMFLQNLTILLAKCPRTEFKNYVLPLMNRALESNNPQVQELCLNILPTVGHMMEFSTLKNAIIPRIRRLCGGCGILAVQVNCLVCIGKLMEHMDKWFVLDDILPIVHEVRSKEPAVLMSILGIYRVAFTHKKLGITKDCLSSRALPFLIPLSMDSNLNLTQFNAFMQLIREMIAKVENEHRSKLEQLHNLQQEQKTLQFGSTSAVPDPVAQNGHGDQKESSMMDDFLSGFGSTSSQPSSALGSSTTASTPAGAYTASILDTTSASDVPTLSRPCLSLEDKQRLAAQQEQMSRFKNQTSLVSSASRAPLAIQGGPPKPKDLTASLMERNLQSMSLGGGGALQRPNYNISMQPQPQPPLVNNNGGLGSQLSIGWTGGQSARPMAPTPTMNMASLDNLFGGTSAPGGGGGGPRQSLNQMRNVGGLQQPFGGSGSAMISGAGGFGLQPPPQAQAKPLSSNDIDDLLG